MTWQSTVDASLLAELNAAQLALLGLSTAELQNTQMGTGIPPNVPNLLSVQQNFGRPAGSTYALFPFPAPGRLWAVTLSAAVATDSTFSSGLSQYYAAVNAGGLTLEIVEL